MSSTREVPQMDWGQVVMNGGPLCFAILDDERPWFCGRAERWAGHDGDHKFVSLQDYLSQREEDVRAEVEQFLIAAIEQVGPSEAASLTLGWLQSTTGKTVPFEETRRRLRRNAAAQEGE